MKGNNLRLRLVIRRNSLPEVRLLFPISLDEEPTIANLLEQVNDTIPLESTDWSLDDYVVEVQDSHGHGFECLHFQTVDSILDKDEELIIRPLFTVDRKKRLLSGREQISTDGRHLVDGVPFGRPRLRVPRGRPPVDIPPLKRRRITAGDDQDDLSVSRHDQAHEEEEEEDEDDDYEEGEDETYSEDQPLRLTEHGEQRADLKRVRKLRVREASPQAGLVEVEDEGDYDYLRDEDIVGQDKRRNVRFSDMLSDEEEEEDDEVDSAGPGKGKKMTARQAQAFSSNVSEQKDHQDRADTESDNDEERLRLDGDGELDSDESDDDGDDDSADLDEAELEEELRALERGDTPLDNGTGEPQEEVDSRPPKRRSKSSTQVKEGLDLSVLDKIASLRAAFPTAQFNMCEKALRSSDMNEREAYWKLRKSNQPKMTADQMRQHLDMLSLSTTVQPSSANDASAFRSNQQNEENGEASEAESVDSVVKHHDEHGFPPGSILDGSASRLVAEALRESGVNVKIPVHVRFGDAEDEARDTAAKEVGLRSQQALPDDPVSDGEEKDSSSYSSSSSESNDSDESNSADSEEEEDEDGDDDDGSSDDSDNDDSGPEVASSRQREVSSGDRTGDDDSHSSSDSNSDAENTSSVKDDGPRTKRRASAVANKQDNMQPQSSSEDDHLSDSSSDASSSSDESDEQNTTVAGSATAPAPGGGKPPGTDSSPAVDTQPGIQTKPGSGSSKTRARNQRRRAAKQAKKAAEAAARSGAVAQKVVSSVGTTTRTPVSECPVNAKSAEFLERKKALLEKLASQAADSELPAATVSADVDTAMSDDPASVSAPDGLQHARSDAGITIPAASTGPATASASSSSRRTTLDVGAGRRMLFASLGLRNPKTKADEDKIRAGLMEGVKPLANPRLGQLADSANQESSVRDQASQQEQEQAQEPGGDDPEAWREKVIYRAVECCQEGIVLSEPPFPFVQRWDPQQQYQTHKRGKRKRRNQGQYQQEYYNDQDDDKLCHKKQKQAYHGDVETSLMSGADTTGYGYEEDVTLDYDDDQGMSVTGPEKDTTDNSFSQLTTDADDLPSLPSDLSRLPVLQPGEAKPGMVITWKQMLVSKATGWAPQVLDLTAVIVQPAEDTDALRVILAKRDRDLDGNEKTFDSEGNRVYDRFEAPDMDDENSEEHADGYRIVYYSDMMEPRILQQPVFSAHTATLTPIVESQVKTTDEVQVEQAVGNTAFVRACLSEITGDTNDTTSDRHERGEREKEGTSREKLRSANADADDSVIPETILQEHSERLQSLETEESVIHVEDVSITDDQRRDISLIMHDAGFQDEIDPVVAQGPCFSLDDMSSPSKQLDEEMSEVAAAISQKDFRPPVRAPSIHSDASSLRSQIIADSAREYPRAIVDENESVQDSQRDITPTVAYPRLPVPSSASGAHSGRQPDPHFTQDWNRDDMLPAVDETGDEVMADSHGQQEDESVEVDRTPTRRTPPVWDSGASEFSLTSSPLPSLEEIFSSARSSHEPARSILSAAVEARKPEEEGDFEYKKAMQLVDEGEDPENGEEWSEQHGQLKRELSSQASHSLAVSKTETSNLGPLQRALSRAVKTEHHDEAGNSSDTAAATTARRRSFIVAKNAQVLSLLTSSPEAEIQENYADDSVDSTYEDQDQEGSDLPSGSGWAKKKLPPRKDRARRGVSVSVLPSDKRQTAPVNRQPAACQGPSSKIVVGSKSGKIRRKTWART